MDTLVSEPPAALASSIVQDNARERAAFSRTASERDASPQPSLSNGDARPLIGRTSAIAQLRRNLERAFSQRRVTLTLIRGELGTGRTRLLELASELAARQWLNTRVLYAGCRSGDCETFAPFHRLLLERFDITPASSPSQVRADMQREVAHILDGVDSHEVHTVTQLLGHVAGVPFPGSALLASLSHAPEDLRARAENALAQLFEGEARTRPLLLLLDDMDRAEAAAFGALEKLTAATKPIAIVVAGDTRILERLAAWRELVPTETIDLAPLEATEVGSLASALSPGLDASPQLVNALWQRSRGNPGLVRELVRALEGSHRPVPARDEGSAACTEPSVEDILCVRLSAMSALARTLLEWACVVGDSFSEAALVALARAEAPHPTPEIDPLLRWTAAESEDEHSLRDALEAVVRSGIVARLGAAGYAFSDATTRAFLYRDLSPQVRQHRHAVIARWLMLSNEPASEGRQAALAHHHEQAGHRARAAQAYLAAAHAARRQLHTSVALTHAQRAVALAEPSEPVLHMHCLREVAALSTTLGQYTLASQALGELAHLAWQLGARSLAGAALNGFARIQRHRAEWNSALDFHERALRLFQAAEDEAGAATTYDGIAHVHLARGGLDAAFQAVQQALSRRRALGDLEGEAASLTTLGFIELDRGHLKAARAQLEAAQGSSDPEVLLQAELGLGKLDHHERQFADASRRFARALGRARSRGDRRLQGVLLRAMAEAQLSLGRADEALELLLRARTLALELQDHAALTDIQQHLALVALARDEPGAEAELTGALRSAREHGTREAIAMAHRGLARMQARTPDAHADGATDAEASFREAIRMFEESGHVREAACTRAELGLYLAHGGAGERARAALGEAYAALKPLCLPELANVTETLERLGA